MSAASLGTRRELQVRDHYRAAGWIAFRAPASLGVADVIALKDGERPHFVEVKATTRSPWVAFSRAPRARLSEAAKTAGAVALLAWWPARGKLTFIPESEWPAQ